MISYHTFQQCQVCAFDLSRLGLFGLLGLLKRITCLLKHSTGFVTCHDQVIVDLDVRVHNIL